MGLLYVDAFINAFSLLTVSCEQLFITLYPTFLHALLGCILLSNVQRRNESNPLLVPLQSTVEREEYGSLGTNRRSDQYTYSASFDEQYTFDNRSHNRGTQSAV